MPEQTHRHFVAIPLGLVIAALIAVVHTTVSASTDRGPAQQMARLIASEEALDIQVSSTVAVHLEPGTVIESSRDGKHVRLQKGHALLKTSDILMLDAGRDITVFAVDASFAVLRDDVTTTVASLLSPIIVSDAGELHLLAPGMQYLWRKGTGKRLDLPPDWYGERVSQATLLELPDTEGTIGSRIAHERVTSEFLNTLFSDLAVSGTNGTLRYALLVRLLAEGSRTDKAAGTELAALLQEDTWLSSSLALVLPRMVIGGHPAAEEIIHAWSGWIIPAALKDSVVSLEAFRTASQIPENMNMRGYPEQALHWQKAAREAGAILRSMGGETQEATSIALKKPLPPVPFTHWSSEQLESLIRRLIISRGGLLAATTEFAPDAATQTVRVTGVYVAEGGRDTGYAFTYDASTGLLIDIVRDGKKLPNALSPETLFP